eukprot:1700819-Rhodomonas_salina.1
MHRALPDPCSTIVFEVHVREIACEAAAPAPAPACSVHHIRPWLEDLLASSLAWLPGLASLTTCPQQRQMLTFIGASSVKPLVCRTGRSVVQSARWMWC